MDIAIDLRGQAEGGADGSGSYENAHLAHQQLVPLVGLNGLFRGWSPRYR